MSDFDREAEREKLREQFAEDEQRRESTERMSELLLQGATMTNKHCDTCGDPVFRYEGQEFCASCQGGQAADQSAEGAPTGQDQGREQAQEVQNRGQSRVRAQEAGQDATDAESVSAGAGSGTAGETAGGAGGHQPAGGAGASPPARQSPPDAAGGEGSGDLAAARAALGRTVTRLARQAEASDDLGRTREYLAATTDAAEALSAVKQADR